MQSKCFYRRTTQIATQNNAEVNNVKIVPMNLQETTSMGILF